jgi:flagellar motor protein MotB
MRGMSRRTGLLWLWMSVAAPLAGASDVVELAPVQAAEKHLPNEEPFTQWSQDPERLVTQSGDRLEQREVVAERAETVKLKNVVPPIRFESGISDIPQSTIERLREILDGMGHLTNVRLHIVGHADDEALSARLAGIYGDNSGLSRERAGEVAEFIQQALDLRPEAISFEWAGDRQPIDSNASDAGRAKNRRVEVEVWHDAVGQHVSMQEVVVPEDIKRIKVCRTETVCLLRYRDGHARRARVKNLVAPLHYDQNTVGVPEQVTAQIAQALHNLQDKRNVTVKFIGFSDDVPLTGRAERIFGTHRAMSKARARRVALAVQEALELPTESVASDGRGANRPLASNDTATGRALNRRIEVEFWHDDPLQALPDDPQPCPDAADAEWVTKVYEPPWGRFAPLAVEDGEASIPAGYADALRRAMSDIAGRENVRLRFVGYTRNERLERRTAIVYGDDIGLSADRARRAMDTIRAELELSEAQAEHEGRGFVHADDVVNAGFLQGATSHVVVEVVYDELALLDDYEGVEITPLTRELRPSNPLALNLMHITVDGEPIDDPGRSSSDTQRCTDVALERTEIQFRFDNLASGLRLSVTAQPSTVAAETSWSGEPSTTERTFASPAVEFQMYTNYPHFIERSEVRIFEEGQSVQAEPLDVAHVGPEGTALWRPAVPRFESPVGVLQYVLRAYDAGGHFDETAPQPLWLTHRDPNGVGPKEHPPRDALQSGYGESDPSIRNIPIGSVGSVHVQGRGIPPEHAVWFAGEPVPVDSHGNFVAEAVLPAGMHTVEVAVLDAEGNGELFLRDLELERSDWFYVGIADVTLSYNRSDGPIDALTGKRSRYGDADAWADGRLAFYLNGKFGEDWSLTASADTGEDQIEDLFTNFLDKTPDSLFRRIDPDYHYPTFGDDSSVEENAPTLGKFYAKLNKSESHALWGNFRVGYVDNELAQVERGLYGGNLHYESESTTRFGEKRLQIDGFAADPGTVASREEFRGTGGSLYFLRSQDILTGSERVRIEVRDKDSGLVTSVVNLRPVLDYDVDYLQGRVLLSEPIGSTVDDDLLVRSQGLSGDETWLVVQYEHSPGFDKVDTLATGGQAHYWFNDFVKLGATASRNEEDDIDSNLYAADLTVRKSAQSWLKLQAGRSEGLVSSTLRSDDGGFRFLGTDSLDLTEAEGNAYRADISIGLADWFEGVGGQGNVYAQQLDAGYSAPGLTALTDTLQFGASFRIPVTEQLHLAGKADSLIQEDGLETHAQELDVGYQLTNHWNVSTGVRNDHREDDSPLVPLTQEEGQRTDAVVQVAYDPNARWRSYGFVQATLVHTDNRDENRRVGVGGAYRLNERLLLDGEVSYGDLGVAAKLGTRYQQSEGTERYLSYVLGDERAATGLHTRRGNLISGLRSRLSDSSSVYLEDRYQHSDAMNGLSKAVGIRLAPSERWKLGASWETGTLIDRLTQAETRRNAGGARIGYGFERLQISTGLEYRFDEAEQLDGSSTERTTWLVRNTMKLQMSDDWRLVGKLNYAHSDSSLGQFFDGGYTEAVVGYAYRPVAHDRLHALAKYTYFYNVPTTDQVTLENTPVQFVQKSHIASVDVTYDLTENWSIGGKYAYRLGKVSLDREDPKFFDNDAHLYVLRTDLRVREHWEGLVEARMLHLPDLDERRVGALVGIYRYLGEHFKVGVGYNFTDFSDDLTNLDYDHQGVFINLIGTL